MDKFDFPLVVVVQVFSNYHNNGLQIISYGLM